MGNMAASHKQPIIPNLGHTATTIGTSVHCHMFPDSIAFTDHKARFFTIKLEVLRNFTNYRKGENRRVLPNRCLPRDDDMTFQFNAGIQNHIWANMTKRPNLAIGVNLSTHFNHRAWMDLDSLGFCAVHVRHQPVPEADPSLR